MMPKKAPRRLPPKKEVDHEAELKEIKKQLKELREGIDLVNGLLVTHAQELDAYAAAMRHGRRINR